MAAATSRDVARAAGVSQPTVSRALRGEPGMSPQTRQRIQDMAAALGYVPIDRGRSLSTRRTGRVGVVAPELTNPFYPQLIEPLRSELDAAGYRPLLVPERLEGDDALRVLADGSLDGVVLTTAVLGDQLPYLLSARGIPVVLTNRELDGAAFDVCVADNYRGGYEVAQLIADLGHRRVAAILGPASTSTARDRAAGFRTGLSERGIPLPADIATHSDFSYAAGFHQVSAMLDLTDPPTAVFCGNDVIALGVCNAAVSRGLSVGDDLTVIGFDDIPMSRWDVFSLTTVHCDLGEMAHAAIEMLLRRIAHAEHPAQRHTVAAELILRGSHGAPRDLR
jgi:LacI family transcriptional regulator